MKIKSAIRDYLDWVYDLISDMSTYRIKSSDIIKALDLEYEPDEFMNHLCEDFYEMNASEVFEINAVVEELIEKKLNSKGK